MRLVLSQAPHHDPLCYKPFTSTHEHRKFDATRSVDIGSERTCIAKIQGESSGGAKEVARHDQDEGQAEDKRLGKWVVPSQQVPALKGRRLA